MEWATEAGVEQLLLRSLHDAVLDGGRPGDCAVLVSSNAADRWTGLLNRAGQPVLRLES